jgi:hypothetical protein
LSPGFEARPAYPVRPGPNSPSSDSPGTGVCRLFQTSFSSRMRAALPASERK